MPIDTLTAKANTGAGTDGLAGRATAGGFAGAVVGTNAAGNDWERLASEATLATIAGAVKMEDSPGVDGDTGFVVLAQRRDSDTAATNADGDYATLKMDEAGRLKTASQPAKYALVTGSITANGQTVFCQCDRGSNVIAHVVATALAGHNSTFEGSIDSTNGTDGAWFAIDAKRTNANTVDLVTGVLAATPAYAWELSVNGFNFIRVRATAHASGTALWKFQQAPYATEPVPVTQVTGTQPVSGTVTATVTAGTVNPVVPATPFILNSAASTNDTLILTGTSGLQAFHAFNNGAAIAYVKLYNKATAPTSGDTPAMVIPIPAGGVSPPLTPGFNGFRFALGMGIRITTGVADNDTGAVAAGQVKVILSRTV
jgi:hypothetical protein